MASHICAVCGTAIPDHHGRFVLPIGHVHQGCKGAAVSGQLRRSSIISCDPESVALKYQWSADFHPPDLALQRNEGPCAQGPNQQDAADYYKMDQSAPEIAASVNQWFGDFESSSPGCPCPAHKAWRAQRTQQARQASRSMEPMLMGPPHLEPVPVPLQPVPDASESALQNIPTPTASAPAPVPMSAEGRIMLAQSEAWTGWSALRRAGSHAPHACQEAVAEVHRPKAGSPIRVGAWFSSGWTSRLRTYSQSESPLESKDFGGLEAVSASGGAYPEVPDGEKYLDPWWRCIRASTVAELAGDQWADGLTGPAYLYGTTPGALPTDVSFNGSLVIPRNGPDRVAAMRHKINRLASNPMSAGVKAMQKQSLEGLRDVAETLYTNFSTADGRESLARQIGIPIDQINEKKDRVLEILSRPEFEIVLRSSEFEKFKSAMGPLYKELMDYVGGEIRKGIDAAAQAIGIGAGAVSGFASAIPIIGSAVMYFADIVIANKDKDDEEKAAKCRSAAEDLKQAAEALASARYPTPWHMEQMLGGAADYKCLGKDEPDHNEDATGRLHSATTIMKEWFQEIDRLPIALRMSVKKWWALAVTLASFDQVKLVFHALGNDPWSGRMATDEQVMLVAAPFAVSNGWDVDEFAAKLWERSEGYRVITYKAPYAAPDYLYKADVILEKTHAFSATEQMPQCGALIRNAFFANLGILAYDAVQLVEEIKASPTGTLIPDVTDADRRAAAATDEWIASECTGGVWHLMGGETPCRMTYENARTKAKAKIARVDLLLAEEARAPKKPEVITPDDRRDAAVTDEWLTGQCESGAWAFLPGGTGPEICRRSYETRRSTAQAKIARVEAAPWDGILLARREPVSTVPAAPLTMSIAPYAPEEKDKATPFASIESGHHAPTILGGLATGVLALAGVSLWWAAAPLAIGLWLGRKTSKPVESQPAPTAPALTLPMASALALPAESSLPMSIISVPEDKTPGAILYGTAEPMMIMARR